MKLNLGCGYRKKEGYVNIDNRGCVDPDMLLNLPDGFVKFEDNSIDEIDADDFLEHIQPAKVIQTMDEIYRILKPEGIFNSCTPDASIGQAAFQDPTHISFWVPNSWLYYTDDQYRDLYGIKAKFELIDIARREQPGDIYHIMVHAKAIK